MHSQREFFYAVLSHGGLPCIAWVSPGASGMRHKVFDNLEQLCNEVDKLDFTKANYYFAVSTLREKQIIERGQSRVRTKTNALFTRCLILDVDLKDGFFVDLGAVIEAANSLADSLSIPHPIIVSSGYGAHVYWPFAEGISSADWTVLARQFKKYIELLHPGLVADATRVSDSASVLRIPNSFNLKNGGQAPVEIVQWSDDITDIGELQKHLGPPPAKTNGNSVVLIVQKDVLPPAQLSVVAKNCNWFGEYLKNKSTASEPEWYATLGLVPYLTHTTAAGEVDGDRIAQAISKGHPSYDPEATTDKLQQVKDGQTGPTTCERFRSINSKRCEGCPFATTVKSPIQTAQLARPATKEEVKQVTVIDKEGNQAQEEVTIPLYPAPYFRGEDGGVFTRVKQKQDDGTWEEHIEKVYDYDLYPVKRYRTELLENEVMEIHLWLPHDGLRTFKLPTELLAEQKKLAVFLAQKGAIPEYGKGLRLAKYLVDYIRHLQSVGAAEVEFSRFGWRDLKSANPKFVVGSGFIDKDGELHAASYAHFLKKPARAAATAGNIEGWREAFSVYRGIPNSEAFILASMMGFAAPLMAFTEYAGVLYNMVGDTSAGKSTSLKLMTSIWGQPNPQHVKIEDNVIPMYNFIGYLNAIPVAMDELTNMAPERLSDFALSFTGGRGKMRANRDGTNQENTIEWDTIVVGTSNTSLYDKLASNRKGYSAEAMRIYEVNLPTAHDIRYQDKVNRAIALLNGNYGHAGREYIKYVIQNIPKIQQLIDDAIRKITVRGALRSEERFWAAMFACVYVGGLISGKVLKLHDYDMQELLDHYLKRNEVVRDSVRASMTDPISLISDFFNSNLDCIIKFKDDKPYLGADGRAMQNIRALKVRMELDSDNVPDTAWVSRPALGEYCAQKKVDPGWLRKELQLIGVLRQENISKRLASGSSLPSNSAIKCWDINMKHPKMVEVLEAL